MTIPLRALIADDHSLFRDGLSTLLKVRFNFAEVIEASTLAEAENYLKAGGKVDVALVDLGMPGVQDPTSLLSLRVYDPDLKIAVITASEIKAVVLASIGSGLNGLIPKSLSIPDLHGALQCILSGQIYVPRLMLTQQPPTADAPVTADRGGGTSPATSGKSEPLLTPRQKEILACVRAGMGNREISNKLGISVNTVKIHISALLAAYQVTTRVQLLEPQ